MNPIDAADYRAPAPADVQRFRESMAGRGYSCFVRTTRGDDVAAACGQLALRPAESERPEA
jgi:23S rRNA (adenine2503-C2)-methyltransferase